MGSEDQVLQLMALLDTALGQADRIEEKLNEYDKKLQVYSICIILQVLNIVFHVLFNTVVSHSCTETTSAIYDNRVLADLSSL